MLDTPRSAPVNGIDIEALGRMVEGINEDTSKASACFNVTTRWAGQTRMESFVSGFTLGGQVVPRRHVIVADEPCELLGQNQAPNPQELLMAAVNSCMMVGYVAGASLKGIKLDSLEIEMDGELDLRGFLGLDDGVPPGYQVVNYVVRISGDGSPAEFEDIHRTVMATSPNYFNLNRPVRMNGKLDVR